MYNHCKRVYTRPIFIACTMFINLYGLCNYGYVYVYFHIGYIMFMDMQRDFFFFWYINNYWMIHDDNCS